jgi:hypothetical protein
MRSRAAGWLFDIIAKRLERSLSRIVDERLASGQPLLFITIPAIAGRLVNDSIAKGLRTAARRAALVWTVAVGIILMLPVLLRA